MIQLLLKTITQTLDRKGIGYMVSGSLALNVYCIPRLTMDVDIVIELDQTNLEMFLQIFSSGYYLNEDTVRKELKRRGMFNVIDHQSGLKIDFIIRKDSEYRMLEFSRKRLTHLDGIPVWMVTPEDLVISKIDWIQQLQSERQINDTTNEIANKQLEIFLSKSETERFRIGEELNLFGRKILENRISFENPGISESELKIEVFKQSYSSFFPEKEMESIVRSMRKFLKEYP